MREVLLSYIVRVLYARGVVIIHSVCSLCERYCYHTQCVFFMREVLLSYTVCVLYARGVVIIHSVCSSAASILRARSRHCVMYMHTQSNAQ